MRDMDSSVTLRRNLSASISPDLYSAVADYAHAADTSMACVVRQALRAHLDLRAQQRLPSAQRAAGATTRHAAGGLAAQHSNEAAV